MVKSAKKSKLEILLSSVEEKKHKIPAWLMTSILIAYILCGGILFTSEGWTYINAVYFLFTSISSIGFGDYVPGKVSPKWFYIGILYIVIGIILFGMVITMAQTFIKSGIEKIEEQIENMNGEKEEAALELDSLQ